MNDKYEYKLGLVKKDRILMVGHCIKHPQILRITTYIGERELVALELIKKGEIRDIFTFWKEVDGKCWIDLERAQLDSNFLVKCSEDNDPIEDWELFNKELWAVGGDGEPGIIWDQNNIEEEKRERKNCCKFISKSLLDLKKHNRSILDDLKSNKNNLSLLLAIVDSWALIKDRCEGCLEIEKSFRTNLKK